MEGPFTIFEFGSILVHVSQAMRGCFEFNRHVSIYSMHGSASFNVWLFWISIDHLAPGPILNRRRNIPQLNRQKTLPLLVTFKVKTTAFRRSDLSAILVAGL